MSDEAEHDEDDDKFCMLCPFLDNDPRYAHGVEFGMLWERMKDEDEISDFFLIDNQEQILLAANRAGWHVESAEPIETPGWFWLVTRRKDEPA